MRGQSPCRFGQMGRPRAGRHRPEPAADRPTPASSRGQRQQAEHRRETHRNGTSISARHAARRARNTTGRQFTGATRKSDRTRLFPLLARTPPAPADLRSRKQTASPSETIQRLLRRSNNGHSANGPVGLLSASGTQTIPGSCGGRTPREPGLLRRNRAAHLTMEGSPPTSEARTSRRKGGWPPAAPGGLCLHTPSVRSSSARTPAGKTRICISCGHRRIDGLGAIEKPDIAKPLERCSDSLRASPVAS
jgi:hypothetical protein